MALMPLLPSGLVQAASMEAKKLDEETKETADSGIDSVISGVFQKLFGQDGDNTGQNSPGMSYMGKFSPRTFVESTLSSARSGQGAEEGGIAKAIGGLMKLVGIGG